VLDVLSSDCNKIIQILIIIKIWIIFLQSDLNMYKDNRAFKGPFSKHMHSKHRDRSIIDYYNLYAFNEYAQLIDL
jgi:hypothetical protein